MRVGADSLALADTLSAGERVIVAFGDNAGAFGRLVALPAGYEDAVVMQDALRLPDRGGIVSITHASGAEIDAFSYGEFYGLSAENAYLADTLIDSLSRRSSLKSVQRAAFGLSVSGSVSEEGSVGDADPGVEPARTEQAVVGSFYLHRGRKVYELKNHLGNVLAVVSDVKLGISNSSLVDYYIADVVEMTDYEPFGMQLSSRHWVSGDGYRFGFQGQEGDDEWSGEGSMLAFKYRVHDVRLGRFLSVDPLSDSYPWNSTYAFSENSVVAFVELEGLEKLKAIDGKAVGVIENFAIDETITAKVEVWEYKMSDNIHSIAVMYIIGLKNEEGGYDDITEENNLCGWQTNCHGASFGTSGNILTDADVHTVLKCNYSKIDGPRIDAVGINYSSEGGSAIHSVSVERKDDNGNLIYRSAWLGGDEVVGDWPSIQEHLGSAHEMYDEYILDTKNNLKLPATFSNTQKTYDGTGRYEAVYDPIGVDKFEWYAPKNEQKGKSNESK